MKRNPVNRGKGQVSTSIQVIFSLMLIMLLLGFIAAKLTYDFQGNLEANFNAILAASAMNALSGMEKGRITMPIENDWGIILTANAIKFKSDGKNGDAIILGNVKEVSFIASGEIHAVKEPEKPAELVKEGE